MKNRHTHTDTQTDRHTHTHTHTHAPWVVIVKICKSFTTLQPKIKDAYWLATSSISMDIDTKHESWLNVGSIEQILLEFYVVIYQYGIC